MFVWLSQGILLKVGYPLGVFTPRHPSATYIYDESRCTRSLMSMAPSIYLVQPTRSEISPIGNPWDATPSRSAPAERSFEEQERCNNIIVLSLWRIHCCCCSHMFIAWVLDLCCFHEIYIAAGSCVFVVVCFILLVVTGLILLLQWLSCCHQVSVILNEISLLHVIWYVRWFVEVVLCFVFFACFILTFTCTCTCKYVAGTYSTL